MARYRSGSLKNRSIAVDIFAIVGAIFTVIGSTASVIAILPDTWKKDTVIEQSQIQVANAIAPDGYAVAHSKVTVVKKNTVFWLDTGEGLLLERTQGQDTIALAEFSGGFNPHPGFIPLYLNGVRHDIKIGEQIKTSDSECFVWPISRAGLTTYITRGGQWDFEYHCNS